MDFYQIVNLAHAGAAILLLALALSSIALAVLIAVKPAVDSANAALVKRANTAGLIQHIVVGIVALTGVTAAFMGSWSFSQFWLWSSLVVVAFYSVALEYITKPARMAVAEGGSEGKVGLQVGLQVAHVLLLLVTFAAMLVKPEL
ncbi:MAG: hypothetical protein JRH16_12675 [Deltaproteobacteria bacterium]|nr:hypothetical protein [Deltaproteobacteria bacterium]MBW2360823.1 hypothetical protein [Deltaproteobacteria bacterium]